MKNKKMLALLLGVVILGGVVAFGAFSSEDGQGKVRTAFKKPVASRSLRKPVVPQAPPAAPVAPGVTFDLVPPSSMNIGTCVGQYPNYVELAQFSVEVEGAPLRLDQILLGTYSGSTAWNGMRLLYDYKVTLSTSQNYAATAIDSFEYSPIGLDGPNGIREHLVTFPNGINLPAGSTYYLTVEGKNDINGFVRNDGARVDLRADSSALNVFGEFNPGTSNAVPAEKGVNVNFGTYKNNLVCN